MRLIPLTQGEYAMVDDEDYDFLSQWKWHCSNERGRKYACRRQYRKDGSRRSKILKMHRVILGLTNPKKLGDHKDGNGLNNQRNNIRKATHKQNLRNRHTVRFLTSKYKGVYKYISTSSYRGKSYKYVYWRSSITVNGKEKGLGHFKYDKNGETDAAKAYDEAAKKYLKEFASLNFK